MSFTYKKQWLKKQKKTIKKALKSKEPRPQPVTLNQTEQVILKLEQIKSEAAKLI